MVSKWLELCAASPRGHATGHRRQAVQQTTLANVISRCRRLAQVQWRELFQRPVGQKANWLPIPVP